MPETKNNTFVLSQNEGRSMSLNLITDLISTMLTWLGAFPAIAGKATTMVESDTLASLSELFLSAVNAEKKPRKKLTVMGVEKTVMQWALELDKLESALPDGFIYCGCRHRLVAYALKLIALEKVDQFGLIPVTADPVTPVREQSVRENIAQLNSKTAKAPEIWGTVKSLLAALFAKVSTENFKVESFDCKVEGTGRGIGRDTFGEFMELKAGTRQKFHHAAKCMENGVSDETIQTGLGLDHKDWGAVWKVVESSVESKADNTAKVAINGLIEDKANKDTPLNATKIKVLEAKAAEMPEILRLLTAIRTGEFASAKTAVNQLAEFCATAERDAKSLEKAVADGFDPKTVVWVDEDEDEDEDEDSDSE
ncbi:MAG: hypothetical protein JRE23_14730 [Deltaproteobacteria bacterium]|nr:hypothetical protein [Deltaproteobacteria bacterium]